MVLKTYGDNRTEARWFNALSPLLAGAGYVPIGGRGTNPPAIEALITYDRPDIILTADDVPVLVVEKTREVPTGHNIGQRMARVVRSAELGVPFIKFLPFDAMKHGRYASMCRLNVRLLEAFARVSEIHDTPVVAVNWPCDDDYELIVDGTEDDRMREIVHAYIESGFDRHHVELERQLESNAAERAARIVQRSEYAAPPRSVVSYNTEAWLAENEGHVSDAGARALAVRDSTVVYTADMTPEKCRRQDPYTGMQFVYDYTMCRTGPAPEDKSANLVLSFPQIDRETWYRMNPDNPNTKSSNWYLTANALMFSDGIDVIRG